MTDAMQPSSLGRYLPMCVGFTLSMKGAVFTR